MDKNLTMFYKKLGENLRQARKRKGYTQQQVADLMGRGKSTISENENGMYEIPFSIVMQYCKIYGVSIEEVTPILEDNK